MGGSSGAYITLMDFLFEKTRLAHAFQKLRRVVMDLDVVTLAP